MRRTALSVGCFLIVNLVGTTGCSDRGGAQPGVPGTPSNLVAAPLGGGVHLTWNDNSMDEELFEIERQEQGTKFATLDSVPFDTAVYHDANVTLGIAYSYRVRAKFASGFSSYSNSASLTLGSSGVGGAGSVGGSASGGEGQVATAGSGGTNSSGGSSASGGQGTAGQGGSGQAGGAAGSPGSAGTGAVQVSFKADIAPVLVKSCGSTTTGCHNADQAVGRIMPQFGPCKVIWYSAVDAPLGAKYTSGPNLGQATGCPDLDLYNRLVGLHSMLCDAPSWDQRVRYVVPGDLKNSLIYQVLAGDASMAGTCKTMDGPVRKMPLVDPKILPNGVALGDAEIAQIRDWILQGAKNN
jgi:hypothetical protein